MKRGPKGYSPEQQKATGETRPYRQVVNLFGDIPDEADEEFAPPRLMTEGAIKIWHAKIARYKARGQKIKGFEDALRLYCELEAKLILDMRTGNFAVTMVNAHRAWANEFFDTPASQRVKASTVGETGNKFAMNGKRKAAND